MDPEEAETKPTSKITKALHSAYELAATNPSLDHFKRILKQFQDETAAFEAEQRELMAQEAEKEAGKKTKEEKKKSRKSKGGDDDVEMDDAEAPKSSKKRKKEADSDGDGAKVSLSQTKPGRRQRNDLLMILFSRRRLPK